MTTTQREFIPRVPVSFHFFPITLIFSVLFLSSIPAPALSTPLIPTDSDLLKRYRACLMKNVKPAQSGVAAAHLQRACQRKFSQKDKLSRPKKTANRAVVYDLNKTDNMDDIPFYDCLLEYLPSVKNDQTARVMHQLCRDQFHPVPDFPPPHKKQNKLLQFLGLGKKRSKDESSHLTIDGDSFAPLVPWQPGR